MLIRVAAYQNAIEAHLARGRLESEGIPAFVFHEHHIWANWLYSWVLGGVKVYVNANDEERAQTVVAAHNRGEYSLQEEEAASVCPKCKSERVVLGRASWKAALLVANLVQIPLWFAWATPKCGACGLMWDLPPTRSYSLIVVTTAGLLVALLLFLLFASLPCVTGKLYYGCRV